MHHVGKKTTDSLGSDDLKTKWAGNFLNSLLADEFLNITAEFWTKGGNHNITLNAKITGHGNSVVKVKEEYLKVKTEILQCMIDNINDQSTDRSKALDILKSDKSEHLKSSLSFKFWLEDVFEFWPEDVFECIWGSNQR